MRQDCCLITLKTLRHTYKMTMLSGEKQATLAAEAINDRQSVKSSTSAVCL